MQIPLLLLSLTLEDPPVARTLVTAPRSDAPATQSAADVTVVTAEELQRTGERSLPRAIERAAGVGVWLQETNVGGGAPILRGLIGEKVLIVIDGVRLNDATTRLGPNQALNTIDPAIVERVEVVRGPASVLYGSDAIGGAILIFTKSRAPGSKNAWGRVHGLQVDAESTYESATNGFRASTGASVAGEKDGFLLIGSYGQWNELRGGTGDLADFGAGKIDNTGYHATGVFGSWMHALDEHRSLRVVGRIHRDFDVPRTDRLNAGFGQTAPSNAEFRFALQDNTAATLAYADTQPNFFGERMQARVFLREYDEIRVLRNNGSTQRRYEEDDIRGYGLGLDFHKNLGADHVLTYGLDLDVDEVQSSRDNLNLSTGVVTAGQPPFAPNSHYQATGVFVRDEIFAFEPFDVTVGARYSRFDFRFNEFTSGPNGGNKVDGDFDALTASLEVARPIGEGLRVSGRVAQGFRAPHLDDLARNATIFGGTELANPDLDPEESLTGEVAFDYVHDTWNGAVAFWYTEIEDAIGRRLVDEGVPATTGDETYLRDNTGEVELYGIELSVKRKLGEADADWAGRVGVSIQQGRQFDDEVNPLTNEATYDDVPARRIPPLYGFASLLYEPAEAESWLQWGELRFTAADGQSRLNPDDLSDPRIDPDGTPGWATLSLDVGGPIGPQPASTWNVGIHNILDRGYRQHGSGVDAPGVNVVVGLKWSF